jgi:uncharacterized protein (TIGR03663 family)
MFWILLIGFTLRSIYLDLKPVHFDEGINGHFVQGIWRDGFYKYDPTNFHGPLYFYILMLAERVFGYGVESFRFATGLINLAAIAVVGLHRRFVGRTAIYAALVLCLSPAFVFYSRYAIHESLFILSQAAFSYGYFLYREEKSTTSLWWMALAIVGLVTTKETFFIFLGTWAIAVYGLAFFEALVPSFASERKTGHGPADVDASRPAPPLQNWIAIAMVAAVLILALFTGFFLYMPGAVDMVTALKIWTHTGTAHTGHEKPFLYWLELLRLYEWPALIGLIATPILFFWAYRSLRILLLVAFGTWLAYSVIPYKTPWLIMNLLWPLSFAAGAVIARVLPPFRFWRGVRTGLAILCFVSIFLSLRETIRLNFRDFAKAGEPYVYVQSTNDFKRAVDTVLAHVKRRPEDVGMKVFAMNRDPWPLPYLLEPLSNVTWGHGETIDVKGADVILADSEDRAALESRMRGTYFVLPFQIRDAYQDGQAYFSFEKFKDDLPAGTPTWTGDGAARADTSESGGAR